jgi:hypothetical protein
MAGKLLLIGGVALVAWWALGMPKSIPELQADIKKLTDQIAPQGADAQDDGGGGDDTSSADDSGGGGGGDVGQGQDLDQQGFDGGGGATGDDQQDTTGGGADQDFGDTTAPPDQDQDTGPAVPQPQRNDGRPADAPDSGAPVLGHPRHHAPHAVAKTHGHYPGKRGWYTKPGHHHCDPDDPQPSGVQCCCTDPSKCSPGHCTSGPAIHHFRLQHHKINHKIVSDFHHPHSEPHHFQHHAIHRHKHHVPPHAVAKTLPASHPHSLTHHKKKILDPFEQAKNFQAHYGYYY